jgi:uncharacterized membrane protein YsdA (DUF1294 family)
MPPHRQSSSSPPSNNIRGGDAYRLFTLFCGLLFLAVAAACYLYTELPLLTTLVVAINITTFISLGLDKSFARSQSMRIPEPVLFVLALLGGSPGTLLAIHVFKHKSRKASFQLALLLIIACQLFLYRAFSPQ